MKPNIRGITILSTVGNGAGSIVFKAREESSGDTVAVKSVTPEIVSAILEHSSMPEYGGDQAKLLRTYLTQVRNEWRLGKFLTQWTGGHNGIPSVRRLVVERDLLFRTRGLHLVMDFAFGDNLRRHKFTLPQMISIYRQAADILRFMHRHNVIHADMKPHHIIVDDEMRVQLLDLGLACKAQGHQKQFVGSPDYMAPEQISGAGVDERTDVYGLGATMFWALTGRTIRPHVTSASAGIDLQIESFETSVRKYNNEVPPALEEIIMRSCSPSRRARLTITEIINRLDRFQ